MSVAAFYLLPRLPSPFGQKARSAIGIEILRRPGLRQVRLPARMAAAMASLGLCLTLLAVASTAAVRLRGATAVPLPALPAPEWTDIPRPFHVYDLDAPMLRAVPLVYSARRRTTGDGREDTLAFGAPGGTAPAFRLRLYRQETATAAPPPPLFAAIAMQGADAGFSIERFGLADLMTTRFGRFEIADVVLAGGPTVHMSCNGFRLALEAPALTIAGLACGAPGVPLARTDVACLIDRLDLAAGGEDRALIDFFAASEARRDRGCIGARLAPDQLHAAWLDDKPVTRSKSSRHH